MAGFDPLAIVAPDLYAKQLSIQRKQALAAQLLSSGMENPTTRFSGLASAGRNILGALLAKSGDSDMAALYAPPDQGQSAPQGQPQAPMPAQSAAPVDPGQITNRPDGPSPQPAAPPQPAPQGQAPMPPTGGPSPAALGAALGGGSAQPQPPMQQPQAQPMQAQQQPRTIPNAMSQAIPDLPGLTHTQSMLEYFQEPQQYWTALAPTPEFRNALYATHGDEQAARQLLLGAAQKAASDNVRQGSAGINYATGQVFSMPNANGIQATFPNGIYGGAQMGLAPGAESALTQSAAASNLGKAQTTPAIGFSPTGTPIATNQAQMLGPPNPGATQAIESRGNPYAVSPAGAVGPMQTMPGTLQSPGFGVTPAQNGSPQEQGRVGADYQQAMMQKYGNPVTAAIAYNWGPGNTDKWLASGADFAKLPPETQNYIGRLAVAQAIPQRGSQNAPQPSGTSGPQQMLPAQMPGQTDYMTSMAKDAAGRHDSTVAAAAESPMRINVLDNIINLSKSGVATGPGQDWQNSVLGYMANTPGLRNIMSGAASNVAKFQELQKFTYQNAIRSWQAAGGTGTDAQMQSMAHANPNDHLFPQALQGIAQWGKAAELAVQAKANAQDNFLQQAGQTPTNQIAFESKWRNAFDPRVFQYTLMSPQEKQAFAQQTLRTPAAAQAFLAKQAQLKALGAIQ